MQRRSFALSVLAGAGILATGCGGGGGEGVDAAPPAPGPGVGPGPGSGPATVAHAYVAMPESAEVAIFGVLEDGTLKAIATVPAEAGTSTVAVHRSGLFAYAVNTDAQTISIYDRDPDAGSLRLKGSFSLSLPGLSGLKFHPTEETAYIASSGGVGVYSIDAGTGALQFVRFRASGPEGVDVHPSGSFLFIARDIGLLEPYRTDDLLQTRVNSIATGQGGVPDEVAVSPSGVFVYVSGRDGIISTHAVDPDTGAASAATLISVGNAGGPLVVHPSGLFAYAGAELDEGRGVVRLAIDQQTGLLSDPTFHQTTEALVLSLAISPSGKFIYAVNSASGNVSAFSVNETTGALTSLGSPIEVGGNAASMCIVGL